MAADWLTNFRVMTELQESYKVIKLASKIQIQRFYDNLMTL